MYHLPVLIIQPCLWPGCMVADRGYVSWLTCSKMWWSNSCSPPQRNRGQGTYKYIHHPALTKLVTPTRSTYTFLSSRVYMSLSRMANSQNRCGIMAHNVLSKKGGEPENYLYQNGLRVQSRYSYWIGWAIEEWDNFFKQQSKNNFLLLFSILVTKRQNRKIRKY